MMPFRYRFQYTVTSEKVFTQQQIQDLLLSVRWVSGQYPEQLYKALLNSQTVLTAWDRDKLVGLQAEYQRFGFPIMEDGVAMQSVNKNF